MAQILTGSYVPLRSQSFNATTSAINFGTAPIAMGAQSCLALIYPKGSGENGFGWIWSRANSTTNGQRFLVDHNGGHPRLEFVGSCSGTNNAPTVALGADSIVYNKWNHVAFRWDGAVSGSNLVMGVSQNFAPMASVVATVLTIGSGSATDSAANSFIIGNSSGGDRTFNGYIAYVARWNRLVGIKEMALAQQHGPLVIPNGLVFCWANGRDYSPYNEVPTSQTAISASTAPMVRGLLQPRRPVWAVGSVPPPPVNDNRWFLMQ